MQTNKQISKKIYNTFTFSQLISHVMAKYSGLFGLAGLAVVGLSAFLLFNNSQTSGNQTAAEMPALSGDAAITHLKKNGSYKSLSEAFEAARYKVEKKETGATANNNANGLQINFNAEGLQLRSADKKNDWSSKWSLSSFGYGGDQTAAEKGDLQTNGRVIGTVCLSN
jgi:hypothetical protein